LHHLLNARMVVHAQIMNDDRTYTAGDRIVRSISFSYFSHNGVVVQVWHVISKWIPTIDIRLRATSYFVRFSHALRASILITERALRARRKPLLAAIDTHMAVQERLLIDAPDLLAFCVLVLAVQFNDTKSGLTEPALMKRIILFLLVSICSAGYGAAQAIDPAKAISTLPDSPSVIMDVLNRTLSSSLGPRRLVDAPPPLTIVTVSSVHKPKTADRRFVLLQLVQFATTVADIETTRYGIRHGGYERNLFIGSHPSIASLYAISIPVDVGLGVWSYRLKKKAPHSGNWMIPPILSGAAHSAAAIWNLSRISR